MALTKVKLIADGVIDVDHLAANHGITTDNIGEGSALYYTDARVLSYLTTNSYATEGFVTTAVSNLVDAAPSTLDTLNELAAALGDDPNFATTVTNSIATKLPLAGGTLTGDLGIGVSPSEKLDVNGHIKVRGVSGNRDGLIHNANSYFSLVSTGDTSVTTGARIWLGNGVSDAGYYQNANGHYFRDLSSNTQVYIDGAGNVGIGGITPLSKLDVNGEISIRGGESADDARMFFRASDNSIRFIIETDLDGITDNDTLNFSTGDSGDILVLKGNRNVGIGTNSPSYKLDVSGDARATGNLISDYRLMLPNMTIGYWDSTYNRIESGSLRPLFITAYSQPIYMGRNGSPGDFTINTDGNVGIGTTSPGQKLHVVGNIYSTGYVQGGLAVTSAFNGYAMFGSNSTSTPLAFGLDGGQYNMVIDTSGKVGIGTTSPTAKLQVSGDVTIGSTSSATRLTVDGGTRSTAFWTEGNPGWQATYSPEGWETVVKTGSVSSSSGATSLDILSVYTDGHWGGSMFGEIWLYTAYYGAGIKKYKFTAARAGYATVTLIDTNAEEMSGIIEVHGQQIIGSGTHGGQSVAKSVIRINTGTSYQSYYAIIKIGFSDNSRKIFDNRSTDGNVQSNRVTNGGAYHFRSVDLTGNPHVSTV